MEIKIYKNGKKIKSKYLIDKFGHVSVNNEEIYESIRETDEDFTFIDVNNGKADITGEQLLSILFAREKEFVMNSDTDLNKIIRNGGFIGYTRHLEERLSVI